ncbi:MAG TPA: GlsB/YeaQ/YmgE family stress response membrane protein [Pirellulales bacterium]|jgi:uncharacterized membrane protein YeaQ/YmgE (transglycosylase-associated protein family)|nr:GlsB/YeaQ/YmgE family stress response membrane protein [Pirellulales bacterium]
MTVPDVHFSETTAALVNDVLVWIGFGTLVGLFAKAIMPGRDPGGALATLLMGIGGTVIGCGMVSFLTDGKRITPISPLGFLVASGGAFVILFFYKMLSGYYFYEGGTNRGGIRGYGSSRGYGGYSRRRGGNTTIIEENR